MATTAQSMSAAASTGGMGTTGQQPQLQLKNRLAESRSPYVRGHKDNPTAWQMWNEETLALAKRSQRLIFLSVGYSSCHWCHVMNRESFSHPSIASLLNAHFIPIKLDREERPDIDRIYMNYVQATTGGGGWPLNVFLTPNLEPLFGGTYWPGPSSTMRGLGGTGSTTTFADILAKMADVWQNQRVRCVESARQITKELGEFAREGMISRDGGGEVDGLDLEHLEEAFAHFDSKWDKRYGGFGSAPKFPTPVNLAFLLRLDAWSAPEVKHVVGEAECKEARQMAFQTLRSIWRGGIKDQVGHGLARYSVTRDWSLPHFEKMLYDNAQLLGAYADAWLVQGRTDEEFKEAIIDVATYLTTKPMCLDNGAFCSSEDADSRYRASDAEKREGAFYVWTSKELQTLLGDRDAPVVAKYYGVKENGNVAPEHDAHDEMMNQNVLCISRTPSELSKEFGLTVEDVKGILANAKAVLKRHREQLRPRPDLDDKVIVAWNGFAIGALARAGAVMMEEEPELGRQWVAASIKAADFIKRDLWAPDDEGRYLLWRVWRDGRSDVKAFADDYAFLISGLIDLYEATWDDQWLAWATTLQETQLDLFNDSTSASPGGFFSTFDTSRAPDLLLRLKDGMDNAEPSTNGVSAMNLNRLSALLADDSYATAAVKTVEAFEAEVMQHPFLFPSLLSSVVIGRLGMTSLQIVGSGARADEVVRRVRSRLMPEGAVVRIGEGAKSEWLVERNELLRDVKVEEGKVRVLKCEGRTCRELSEKEIEEL